MGRSRSIIVFAKTREVYNFMINGSKQPKIIVQYFSTKWTDEDFFNIKTSELSKQRTIYNYIKRVKDTFLNFENEVESEKGRQLARLDDLYANNIRIQDFKAAKDVIKEINQMLGFNAPDKIQHSGDIVIGDPFKQIRENAEINDKAETSD